MSDTVRSTGPAPAQAVAVVHASEELDLVTAPALRAALHECIEAGYPIIHVDMNDVTFVDCRGISVAVMARNEAALRGLHLRIVRPSPAARRLLELTRLVDLLASAPPVPKSRPGHGEAR
ncbi:STAS domain-containing protein [Nocardioides pyridinolyticus]